MQAQRLTDTTMTDPESLRSVRIAKYEREYAVEDQVPAGSGHSPLSVPARRMDAALMTPPLRPATRSFARPPS
ncbi:hypothetical protein [Streptomyces sp. NPDC058086]|uniref:hypothetical protein n=1 Tax=Streptomyces sp. NPDC058086 TaxID=3346334 RepID=UPI0036F0DB9A